jgi:hypothetical protein
MRDLIQKAIIKGNNTTEVMNKFRVSYPNSRLISSRVEWVGGIKHLEILFVTDTFDAWEFVDKII